MSRFQFLAAALPAFTLAACGDSTTSSPVGPSPEFAVASSRGAILARSYCGQCHGEDLSGSSSALQTCPSMRVLQHYSFDEFEALLTAGVKADGEVASTMVLASEQLGPDDRRAIYDYLAVTPTR